jgi:aspartate kinase
MKFGGTSIKDADAFKNVASIIQNKLKQKPIVVLSAMAGITDLLEESITAAVKQNVKVVEHYADRIKSTHLKAINKLFGRATYSESLAYFVNTEIERLRVLLSAVETIRVQTDNLTHAILSTGELLSSKILNSYFKYQGLEAQYIDARNYMITTDPQNGIKPVQKTIRKEARQHFLPLLRKCDVITTQGYIAATEEGVPTTLGRNGSDYSASLLGAALDAEEIQIWTDVNGILTADPTIVSYARPLELMTFEEACELAYFGARVLHPASIQPALEKGIPVRVLNSNFPEEKGTIIVTQAVSGTESCVKSIAYKEHITLISLQSSKLLVSPEILGEFFQQMTQYGKHVYAVNKSATKLSLTIEKQENLNEILRKFKFNGDVKVESKKTIVTVVGQNIKDNPIIIWKIIKMLQEADVKLELISQISSQISFMFIIDEIDIDKTVKLLHKEFIEPNWSLKTA